MLPLITIATSIIPPKIVTNIINNLIVMTRVLPLLIVVSIITIAKRAHSGTSPRSQEVPWVPGGPWPRGVDQKAPRDWGLGILSMNRRWEDSMWFPLDSRFQRFQPVGSFWLLLYFNNFHDTDPCCEQLLWSCHQESPFFWNANGNWVGWCVCTICTMHTLHTLHTLHTCPQSSDVLPVDFDEPWCTRQIPEALRGNRGSTSSETTTSDTGRPEGWGIGPDHQMGSWKRHGGRIYEWNVAIKGG